MLVSACLTIVVPARGDTAREFSGSFRQDTGRSLMAHGRPPDRELIYEIEIGADRALLVQRGVLPDGRPFERRWTGKADGVRREVVGGGPTLSLVLDGPTMRVTGEDANGVFLNQRCKLVEKGKALTCRGTRRGPDTAMDNFFDWYQRQE
jgi:hypothetical protein